MRIVAGLWGGRRIQAPPGRATRPTTDRVREAWLSSVSHLLPDAGALDLFAGSGALGLEALSRGARHCTFVESAPAALRVLQLNLTSLGIDEDTYRIVRSDVATFIARARLLEYDIAFADPPYATGDATRTVERFLMQPFARFLCVEHAPSETLPGTPVRVRRYGDTVLTFFSASDEPS